MCFAMGLCNLIVLFIANCTVHSSIQIQPESFSVSVLPLLSNHTDKLCLTFLTSCCVWNYDDVLILLYPIIGGLFISISKLF